MSLVSNLGNVYTPVSGQTLPKGDFSLGADCHNPSVGRTFSLGADTDIRIEAKTQQETTQQNCVVLTVLDVKSKQKQRPV